MLFRCNSSTSTFNFELNHLAPSTVQGTGLNPCWPPLRRTRPWPGVTCMQVTWKLLDPMRDLGRHRMPYDTKSCGGCGPVRSCELCGDVWAPFGILSFVSKKIQKDPKSVKTSESATNEARQYQHYPIFSHRVLQHGFSDGCTLMWGPTVKFQESRPVVWDMPGLRWCHVFQSTKSLENP